MDQIAVLYICTGKYSVFWKDFYESSEKYFIRDAVKRYYVFSDDKELCYINEKNVHFIFQEKLGWPYDSLLRYKLFLSIKEQLRSNDYIFFFNANAIFRQEVFAIDILPRREKQEKIVVVEHAREAKIRAYLRTYDRNPECKAFIPYGFGKTYVAGGINGGCSDAFLTMCQVINHMTERDLSKRIIALWHDESYLNKYIYKHKHYRLLPSEYCFPCSWLNEDQTNNHIIDMRDKDKYFSVNVVKKDADVTSIKPIYRIVNKVMFKVAKTVDHLKIER